MGYVVDIIIVAFIALSIFIGYKRGLIKAVLNIFSFVIAIVLALVLYKPISNFVINNTTIDDTIRTTIYEKLAPQELTLENAEALKQQNIPQNILDSITKYISEASKDAQNDVATIVSQKLTELAINIGVALIVFILAKITLKLIKAIGDGIAKIPLIKQLNKVGGIAYGAIEGVLITYVALAIISLISPLVNNTTITNNINESYLGKRMYNNNIILNIFF